MPEKKKRKTEKKKAPHATTELDRTKTRKEAMEFFESFSPTQLNATLFTMLAAAFMADGAGFIFQEVGGNGFIRIWFMIEILSVVLFVISLSLLSLGNMLFVLRAKRSLYLISYLFFLAGFLVFLTSLIYMLYILFTHAGY